MLKRLLLDRHASAGCAVSLTEVFPGIRPHEPARTRPLRVTPVAAACIVLTLGSLSRSFALPQSETLLAGETLLARLDEAISSKTAREGDRVEADVLGPLTVNRKLALPKGTRLNGTVAAARPANKQKQIPARLKLIFDHVVFPDGRTIPLNGWVEENGLGFSNGRGKTIVVAGAFGFAVLGAAMGAIAHGLQGAGVGAAVGGSVGIVVGIVNVGPLLKGNWRDVIIRKRGWIRVHLDQDVQIPLAPSSKP